MLTADQIRQKYLDFFVERGHTVVPSSPLVPENDPTTLFTGSGMQPMLPYLLGQPNPLGTRLVDSQKCFRAQDIEEVGDNRHDTFFEMLGNWSLGDYFKSEQQTWIWEFFTQELKLDPNKLYVSVFAGNIEIPKDDEAVNIWKKLGVLADHIYYYDEKKNWWARSSYQNMPVGEPGGPSSEVFYEFTHVPHNSEYGEKCHPNCDCGRFIEIGNNVFMSYKKTQTGFEPLAKKNIDFGGGLERISAAVDNDPDIFNTSLFKKIITSIDIPYADENKKPMRVIADHFRAATFLIKDGVVPGNKAQGYFLRRLLRRAAVKNKQLQGKGLDKVVEAIVDTYPIYFSPSDIQPIKEVITEELNKFDKTLGAGLRELGKVSAFDLYQSYGFPLEIIEELYQQRGLDLDKEKFEKLKIEHQDLSRTAGKGMFKGGLQDQSEVTTKYHTATHLLHAALRQVLGGHVSQKGSNITGERLRFDFSHPEKLTSGEIQQIEDLVNQKIDEDIPVDKQQKDKKTALSEGALAFFPEKYPEIANVYSIGDFSKELCGGPHVSSTGQIGRIKIIKEESVGTGVRRLYAQLAHGTAFS
jgi:alanyl-tRNA synthetase